MSLLLWFFVMFILFAFSKIFNLRIGKKIPRIFHKGVLKILNIKISLFGKLEINKPGLIISNHASWLDIIILSSLTDTSFIAKSEIASWPIIGFLAKLQNTLFIERKVQKVANQKFQILEYLSNGNKLVLFAEGTSSDGNRVLNFKSSLFSVGETKKGKLGNFIFQAVTICYSGLNGLPISRSQRPIIAWWGNMNLFSHLWNVFSLSSINITVTAHEPIQNVQDRKSMSKIAWKQVAYGMGNALSGHPNPVRLEKIMNGCI